MLLIFYVFMLTDVRFAPGVQGVAPKNSLLWVFSWQENNEVLCTEAFFEIICLFTGNKVYTGPETWAMSQCHICRFIYSIQCHYQPNCQCHVSLFKEKISATFLV